MAHTESSHHTPALVADLAMAPKSQKNGPIIEPSYMTTAVGEGDMAAVAIAATALAGASSLPAEPPMPPPIAVIDPTASAPHSALAGAVTGGQAIITSPPAAAVVAAVVAAAPTRDTSLLLPGSAGGVSHSQSSSASSPSKMLFSDLYRSTKSPLSRLRPQSTLPTPGSDFDADLVSKDKVKNKEAVKRYLAERIRNDWEFKWPRANRATLNSDLQQPSEAVDPAFTEEAKDQDNEDSNGAPSPGNQDLEVEEPDDDDDNDSDDETASVYSTVSEDTAHFRPRLEWWSDFSDDDSPALPSAYRFDTPDAVGPTVQASAEVKRAKRRRAIREEETWNGGLACFNARRDAWTGAKVARVKPKPPSTPTTPSSAPRRMSFFRFVSTSPPVSPGLPLSPTATRTSGDTTAVTSSDGDSKEAPRLDSSQYPVETLLPLAPPLLPPANPMRASITPATYPNLYDRIIVHSLTPSCPVNLADVLRSCVVGWKRDGEWPPRPADAPVPVVAVKKKKPSNAANHNQRPSTARRMSLGFLGRRESTAAEAQAAEAVHEDGGSGAKGIRKSIQRVLGFGHERSGSTASNNAVA